MSIVKEIKKCPHCRETIAVNATKCKHCHSELTKPDKHEPFLKKYQTFRLGFLCGILFTLILVTVFYMHFYVE